MWTASFQVISVQWQPDGGSLLLLGRDQMCVCFLTTPPDPNDTTATAATASTAAVTNIQSSNASAGVTMAAEWKGHGSVWFEACCVRSLGLCYVLFGHTFHEKFGLYACNGICKYVWYLSRTSWLSCAPTLPVGFYTVTVKVVRICWSSCSTFLLQSLIICRIAKQAEHPHTLLHQ